ncbi:MAG TPA: ABC transporter substrate-binding protein [Candidatus Binatia bacterium]|nr:ABC transporter substrate-binding protein [Candidatus Binatia bacterium]
MPPRSSGFFILGIIVSACFFAPATPGAAQTKFEKLHVGYSAQAGSLAPIWVTKEAGLFKKHGLDVELLFIPGGPTAVAALLSGEVPVTVVGGPAVVSSNLAGSDLVMIAGIVNTFAFQIVTVKSITSYQQLKGKRLGVNRFGASPDVAARFALKHMGIDPKEITILQLGEQSTRLTAMMAGQLEAAVFLPPITTMAQKQGMNVLLDLAELGAEFQITGLGSSQKFLAQRRPAAIKFMQAFVEGIYYYKTHKPESVKTIAKYMKINDLEAVSATYDYFAPKVVPQKPYPSLKGIKALIDLAANDKPDLRNLSPERFVNTTILREVDESGFIDRLYR